MLKCSALHSHTFPAAAKGHVLKATLKIIHNCRSPAGQLYTAYTAQKTMQKRLSQNAFLQSGALLSCNHSAKWQLHDRERVSLARVVKQVAASTKGIARVGTVDCSVYNTIARGRMRIYFRLCAFNRPTAQCRTRLQSMQTQLPRPYTVRYRSVYCTMATAGPRTASRGTLQMLHLTRALLSAGVLFSADSAPCRASGTGNKIPTTYPQTH